MDESGDMVVMAPVPAEALAHLVAGGPPVEAASTVGLASQD